MLYHVSVELNKDYIRIDGADITIGIKAKPVDGAANVEIIKKIAKQMRVPSSCVIIKSGHRSKDKIVQILDKF
ncbi:MAG: DUF167 domain-containing protein [Candidatus Nitrosotenuis sp.]